jgi:hypothetical protein
VLFGLAISEAYPAWTAAQRGLQQLVEGVAAAHAALVQQADVARSSTVA